MSADDAPDEMRDDEGNEGTGTVLDQNTEEYFEELEAQLTEALNLAERARARGGDPEPDVEIPVATDMADRVENLLGIEGVAERVRELEADHSREEAALALARDFAEGTVGSFDSPAGKIEGAVRTAVALLTEGVVAAPIEGIDGVELLENGDGSTFVNIYYAGPIRSAGGTAQALSVLVADYARALLDIEEYRARPEEVERYAAELDLYDDETGLQYTPSADEVRFIARHIPVMLDGEPTGDDEVTGYRDLDRVDTNRARGGMCLVLGEGLAQKAPKIKRYTDDIEAVDWPWLEDLIDGTVGGEDADEPAEVDDSAEAGTEKSEPPIRDETATPSASGADGTAGAERADGPTGPTRPDPSKKFLTDLIAGRPVLSHPSAAGGFRLRYGRARNHGFATAGVHPATMHLVDDFLAAGTQLKTERPGKAAGVVPVDTIEGPTVKLANGDVRRIDDPDEGREVRNGVVEILDLGEYLVNYGEFVENNHPLAPAGWTVEWWEREMASAGAELQAFRDDPRMDLADPSAARAIRWAQSADVPLHPAYTYCWHDVSVEELDALAGAIAEATLEDGRLVLERGDGLHRTLERLLVEHHQRSETLEVPDPLALVRSAGCVPLDGDGEPVSVAGADGDPLETATAFEREWTLEALSDAARSWDGGANAVRAVCEIAPFDVRERAPTRIGGRMGRPEKSERRELSPAVHVLFPIGDAGGDQRDVEKAATEYEHESGETGLVEVAIARRRCPDCDTVTHRGRCPACGEWTDLEHHCDRCDRTLESPTGEGADATATVECPGCERSIAPVDYRPLDVGDAFDEALESVGLRPTEFEICKGVKGLTSSAKVPEPLEKGILRARHDVSAFKDGTIRYDMTDLPVTAVRASELDVTVDQLRALGYDTDVHGDPLAHEDQLVELKIQDVVLPDGAAEYMLQTADFVDDLLERYYDMEPYYELEDRDDLVGELVFGMAPHTSAAVVGRVVGFTSAAVGYAHPYFHASKRRNCDGDEDCVMLLLDGLLNFSNSYLPDRRGGRMDAPLVMTSRIDPTEIDDEAHNVDIVESYPLEFYEATLEMADPSSVDVRLAADTLETDEAYRNFRFTHDTSDIAVGPDLSAYKTLGPMTDKMDSQLELARKLRAVDETDVAERVIEYHFLPDLLGNLRAFTSQEMRCVACGEKYRRVPLTETCRECGGNVTLTVHEGSVTKYLETATHVAAEYGCREYTKQRLEVLDRSIESLFENDKNKQSGIADFM